MYFIFFCQLVNKQISIYLSISLSLSLSRPRTHVSCYCSAVALAALLICCCYCCSCCCTAPLTITHTEKHARTRVTLVARSSVRRNGPGENTGFARVLAFRSVRACALAALRRVPTTRPASRCALATPASSQIPRPIIIISHSSKSFLPPHVTSL